MRFSAAEREALDRLGQDLDMSVSGLISAALGLPAPESTRRTRRRRSAKAAIVVTDEAREEPIFTLRQRPPLERLASELRAVRVEPAAHSHREIVRHGIRSRLAPDRRALADRYAELLLTAGEIDVAPPPPPEDYWAMTATERNDARWRLPVDEWEPLEQRLAAAGLFVAEP